MRRARALARVQLAGSSLCFGLMAVLVRLLARRPGGFGAGHLSVIRFVVGVAFSVALFRARPGLYQPRNLRMLVSRGISGGIVVVLYFAALARIPAGEAGMLYNLFPVLATVMAIFTMDERPTVHLALALAVATVGVVLVLGEGSGRFGLGWGEVFAVGSAFFAATSANIIRVMRGSENAPTIFFWFCLAGLPVVAPFALTAWPTSPSAWAIALAMGLSAVGAQLLMTQAYGALSVPEAAVWLQLTPIAQYALAAVLLAERPRPLALVGVVVGVAGVAYGTVLGKRAPAPPGLARSAAGPPAPR